MINTGCTLRGLYVSKMGLWAHTPGLFMGSNHTDHDCKGRKAYRYHGLLIPCFTENKAQLLHVLPSVRCFNKLIWIHLKCGWG
jgi:hypothetical protein